MLFDPENNIVKLCAEGMNREGLGKPAEANQLYQQAWAEAQNDLEKFIAAHYLARQQSSVADKLKWDETALSFALKIKEEGVKGSLPSLYLNIGKGYEDLEDFEKAKNNYMLGESYLAYLADDGYGKMIRSGLAAGIERVGR